MHSIADNLAWATAALQAGDDDPRRDAEVLLCEALHCARTHLLAYGERQLNEMEQRHFEQWVQRRVSGEPVAYIVGKREFWSLPLCVNASTLIPRPDTEVLVETALQLCQKETARVLDLGTGTGAIALALAKEKPQWQVLAVDVQTAAVALAQQNSEQLGLHNVRVLQSDWFSALAQQEKKKYFDMIVSNPPYIAEDDPHLQRGDVRFEPHSALVSDHQGYADLFAIADTAKDFLTSDGWLLLEHGAEQGFRLRAHLQASGYMGVHTVRDYASNERVTAGQWVKT